MTQNTQNAKPFAGEIAAGTSRRDFLKFCSAVAAVIGMPGMTREVAAALTAATRPPVLWLHFAECTGCTESVLRTVDPYIDDLLLDTISMEYHETLMAGAGSTVHEILYESAQKYSGQFFAVVEGAIPTADNGIYGMINGKTMLSIARDILPRAKAVLCIGTCSSFGGVAASLPNPTGARGVKDALKDLTVPVVNVSGCPPNPVNFVGVIANYLLRGTLPDLDSNGRPTFAYGRSVHDMCPYESDQLEYRCLEDDGCKGPQCRNNCPSIKYNDNTSFPMQAGHPCIGCSEPFFWDTMSPFYRDYNRSRAQAILEQIRQEIDRPVRVGPAPRLQPQTIPDQAVLYDLAGRKVGKARMRDGRLVAMQPGTSRGMYLVKNKLGVFQKVQL